MKTLIITFLTGCSALLAQTASVHVTGFILPEIKINQKHSSNDIVYHFEDEYNLFSLVNDTLYGDGSKSTYSASINDITKIEFRSGNHVGLGAMYTGALGFLGGFLFGAIRQSNPLINKDNDLVSVMGYGLVYGLLFSVPFGLVGTLIGYEWERFEEVILPGSSPSVKRAALIEAFSSRGHKYFKNGR